VEQDRQQLIDQANAADPPDQIKGASEVFYRWLANHPDDFVIINEIADLTLTEARKALNPPAEPRESDISASNRVGEGDVPPNGEERSSPWWRRIFGG